MKQLICNTKFKLDPFSDGGSKRSVQIREVLERNGIPYVNDGFIIPTNTPMVQLVKWALRAVGFISRHYPKKEIKSLSKYIQLVKYYALRIPIVMDKYKDQDVDFLWENTNDRDMLYLLKATGHRVIGMPHNIESLVRGKSAIALGAEVANLRRCDAVFTISKEETWLLRLMGLNAHYFPYYPPQAAESFLLAIRRKREQRIPKPCKVFTLLGSATNIPTRSGMQALVDYAATQDLPFKLIVAGYGTESLKPISNSQIVFRGTLSNKELEKLLIDIDGIVIYQPPTTGALTRIPEMLLAGIPVFANFNAARNYFGIKGIEQYNTFEELFEMLKTQVGVLSIEFEQDDSAERVFSSLITHL